jgi:hypothetical protein
VLWNGVLEDDLGTGEGVSHLLLLTQLFVWQQLSLEREEDVLSLGYDFISEVVVAGVVEIGL